MIQIFKNAFLLFLLFGIISPGLRASSVLPADKTEYKKEIKKNFKMSANGTVGLTNKYGDINLRTWNKNEVNIEVVITVKARNESNANEVFDRININFSNSGADVRAETEIDSQKSSWWGNGDKGDFRIDYEVSIPDAASLELANKYGDAFIATIGGSADIIVKYGNFNMESAGKNVRIDLGYGNGSINKVKDLEVDVKYSKLKVESAKTVTIDSKYSKINIDEAGIVKSNSKYDSYDLGMIEALENDGKYDHFEVSSAKRVRVVSKYSDFEVDKLAQEGSFDLSYGGCTIGALQAGFSQVSVDGEHSNAKIYMSDKVAFNLDAVCEHASLSYPSGMNVSYESKKDYTHSIKGNRGASGGMIKVRLTYGGLKMR